ncbi:MAG: sulfatase-like hydrolase/transferase [Lentisphaeria bacterium]|nr:sulfatase-like hydrolase/transferase [Lentisphaeria bacterium]
MMMFKKDFRFLPSYFCTVYFLFFLTMFLFLLHNPVWSVATYLVMIPALLVYPFLYLLPGIALTLLGMFCTRKSDKLSRLVTGTVIFITVFASHLFLLLDAGLFFRYGYHINFHVLNIFTTPGGFEGMGLVTIEILSFAGGILLLALFHAGLLYSFLRFPRLTFFLPSKGLYYAIFPAVATVLFCISIFTYAYAHYMMQSTPLVSASSIPFYAKTTGASFFKKLGLKRPARNAMILKLANEDFIKNYPQNPVERTKDHPVYNVIWLACESWAKRLFTEEIMPQTAEFAKKAVLFKKHYSGGNVTRQGVFSMFYAIPGSYWHPFLAAREEPLFIKWLQEDGYSIKCITSSKFSYPEFDQTIFATIPAEDLHSDSSGATYERDQRNIKLLLRSIEEGAASGKPFMRFMFFESTHHPYAFPEEATVYKDYLKSFNIVQTSAKDAPAIFRRAANSARHLDMCLGQVFALLQKKDLLKNTIVVVVGDHGEEYYEKGYLGHSSNFNNEQTMTPLILYYPGIKPGVYEDMSSHLDIVPMLAKFFGVKNPSGDFSCGYDLLSAEKPRRRYALIADWDRVFFAGEKYKTLIPTDVHSAAAQVITDADDKKLPDTGLFYKEYGKDLIQVQKELTIFTHHD